MNPFMNRVDSLKGVAATLGVNIIERDARGLTTAGMASWVKGNATGITASGLITAVEGNSRGLTTAGMASGFDGSATGMTVSILSNCIGDNATGLTAGLVNIIDKNANGLTAAAVNLIEGNTKGILVSLLGASVGGAVKGFAASIITRCHSFKGVMLGLINFTETASRGVQLGLLNIRMDAPWYAKAIPFIAIRFSGVPKERAIPVKALMEAYNTARQLQDEADMERCRVLPLRR